MKKLLLMIMIVALVASCDSDKVTQATTPVTFENYNQAETARNFNNWAKIGANNKLLHLKKLSPIGNSAPTIRMNLDTLYSVGVFDNDGEITVTMRESNIYQSIIVLDEDGYTPFFFTKPGTYQIKHASKTLVIAVRTMVKDRHSRHSFEEAYEAQKGIEVEGFGAKNYVMPAYDQEQLHKLTSIYKEKMLTAGIPYVFGDGVTPVNEEHRTWSNAAGWGGMPTKVGVSNSYTSSENLSGDVPYAVTFPEPGNAFFTSFTLYDTEGYLMDGNSHINSFTWKPNDDGSITIHFNAPGKINNITSGGKDFNYIVRNYGASQKVIDGEINPIKPSPVK